MLRFLVFGLAATFVGSVSAAPVGSTKRNFLDLHIPKSEIGPQPLPTTITKDISFFIVSTPNDAELAPTIKHNLTNAFRTACSDAGLNATAIHTESRSDRERLAKVDPDFGALDLGAVFQKGANIKAKQLVGEGMYVFVEMTVVGPRDGEWLGRVEEARKEIVRRVEGEGYQVMGFDLKEEGDGDLDRVEELS